MPLVIEDGSDVAGANSFVTADEILAYALMRGVVIPNDSDQVDVLAIKAMDYIVSQCLRGELAYSDQSCPFPRKGLVRGDEVEGYIFTIPTGVKTAQMQLCMDSFSGIVLTASNAPGANVVMEKVGPLQTQYSETMVFITPTLIVAEAALKPYLCGQGGFGLTTYRI